MKTLKLFSLFFVGILITSLGSCECFRKKNITPNKTAETTDLLKGIGIGFCSAALLIIWTSYYSSIQVVSSGSDYLIKFTKDVTFIHRVKLKRELMALPEGSKLVIDGSRTLYIDHDIYSTIEDFRWVAEKRNISIELVEVENKSFSRMATNMIKARSLKGKKYGKLQKTASKQ